MKDTFSIKYRKQGQWFWRTVKNVKDDWIVYGRYEDVVLPNGSFTKVGHEPMFRAFLDEEDNLYYIPLDSEVMFPKERQAVITNRMSKEAGVPVMRA